MTTVAQPSAAPAPNEPFSLDREISADLSRVEESHAHSTISSTPPQTVDSETGIYKSANSLSDTELPAKGLDSDMNSNFTNSMDKNVTVQFNTSPALKSNSGAIFGSNIPKPSTSQLSRSQKGCSGAAGDERNGDTDSQFCLTCHECVTHQDTKHESHEIVKVSETLTVQRDQCKTLQENVEQHLNGTTQWKTTLTTLHQQIVSKRKSIAVQLDSMFSELEHKLYERKMELFTALTDSSHHKECYMEGQIDYMVSEHDRLIDLKTRIDELSAKTGDQDLIAYNCHKLADYNEELSAHTNMLETYCLGENTDLRFDTRGLNDTRKCLSAVGRILSSEVIPCKSTASGDGLKKCNIGKQTQVRLTLRNRHGQIIREKDIPITVELYSTDIHVVCQCTENSNGTHSIVYIAPEPGKYKLSVKVFGQPIKDSPYNVHALIGSRLQSSRTMADKYQITRLHETKSPAKVISAERKTPETSHRISTSSRFSPAANMTSSRVTSPRSVCSNESFSSLKILPKSPRSHPDQIPDPPVGDYLALIGSYGRKGGQFSNPQGLAISPKGRIFVTDSSNQNIQWFHDDGGYISNQSKRGRQPGQMLRPIGITFSSDGTLIFSDYENKCVNLFKDRVFVRRIGYGKLIGPKGVYLTPRNTLLVADSKGNQVLEFSFQGRLIRSLGGDRKKPESHLAGPHYIAMDEDGNSYITDFHKHCIKVFNKEGEYQREFGRHGSGNGEFNAPTGLTIDQSGNLLVADWGNSRIQVFDPAGIFLAMVDTSDAPLFGPQALTTLPDSRVVVCDSGNHCVKIFRYSSTN